jgi:hypothetical protein
MRSPVSPVIANLCMEEIEEEAISNAPKILVPLRGRLP